MHKELIYCIYITLPDEQGGCLQCNDIEVVWVVNIFNDPVVDGWIIPLGKGKDLPKYLKRTIWVSVSQVKKIQKGKGSNSFTTGHGAEEDNLPSKIFVSSIIMFNK